MYFKSLLEKLVGLFVKKGRIYIDHSSVVSIPDDVIIAIVSPYARITGPKDRVYAYISLTEISEASPLFREVPVEILVKYEKKWGSWLVDIEKSMWMDILEKEVAYVLESGFRHVFIDTVDGVEMLCKLFKKRSFSYRQAARTILEHLRRMVPGKILLNRSFFIYQEISHLIDAVLIESFFFTEQDGSTRKMTHDELSWLRQQVAMVQRDGKEVYAIDYPAEAKKSWYFYRLRAQTKGIVWDVAT